MRSGHLIGASVKGSSGRDRELGLTEMTAVGHGHAQAIARLERARPQRIDCRRRNPRVAGVIVMSMLIFDASHVEAAFFAPWSNDVIFIRWRRPSRLNTEPRCGSSEYASSSVSAL